MMGNSDAEIVHITDHLGICRGNINVGIVYEDDRCLLVDLGDGSVLTKLDELGLRPDHLVFTHHHRDQACGIGLVPTGMRMGVPEMERWLFEDVGRYWRDGANRWHLYNFHPHHLALAESTEVTESYSDGNHFAWGPATITVISTPGHTDGSMSYLIEVDGKRICFSGDLIYDGEGRLWELYSLQKGMETTDYHGFMGSRNEVIDSLNKILDREPDLLVPSHGEIITDPGDVVTKLGGRLSKCYDTWASTSSLRYYFPKLFPGYLDGPKVMTISEGLPVPDILRHIGTSWFIKSESGSCFAMDCGMEKALDGTREMLDRGDVEDIEGLWITHYHDDHVDFAPRFSEEFGCEIYAENHVADVIEDPLSWRIPCISPVRVEVDRRMADGYQWTWREFKMTAHHLPGQTLYSGGLLVEGRGLRMLFSGDSFTPGGTDDHCCGNRTMIGKELGYDRCLGILRRFRPTHVFNAHVDVAFRFDEDQLSYMEENQSSRPDVFRGLFPWDDPNYGMDEHWIRCHPYEQISRPGETFEVDVVAINHSETERRMECTLAAPAGWGDTPVGSIDLPPGVEDSVRLALEVPEEVESGLYVIPVDVIYGSRYLPQFTEAVLRVE
jgi:glyoxylase-like metal-dependent hydrolase (beta-lactamase superfamily II)